MRRDHAEIFAFCQSLSDHPYASVIPWYTSMSRLVVSTGKKDSLLVFYSPSAREVSLDYRQRNQAGQEPPHERSCGDPLDAIPDASRQLDYFVSWHKRRGRPKPRAG